MYKKFMAVQAVAELLPWPSRPHAVGYKIKDYTHLNGLWQLQVFPAYLLPPNHVPNAIHARPYGVLLSEWGTQSSKHISGFLLEGGIVRPETHVSQQCQSDAECKGILPSFKYCI